MKRWKYRAGMIILAGMLLTGCGSQKGVKKEEGARNEKQEETKENVYGSLTELYQENGHKKQTAPKGVESLSAEELEARNCILLYQEDQQVSFIGGTYADQPVTSWEEAYDSLYTVKDLLSIDLQSLVPLNCYEEEAGTYYSFIQTEGDSLKSGAVVHVIVDHSHILQGLSISDGNADNVYAVTCTKRAPDYTSNAFFEKLQPVTASAVDVSGQAIEVPAMYDEEAGCYYLGDCSRRIVVGVYEENLDNNAIFPFLSSKENRWEDPEAVTLLHNMIQVYDFFVKEMNWYSVDGTGIPLMIYTHGSQSGDNNADYDGVRRDFAWINVADCYVNSMGILIHEFTHGIFGSNARASRYYNEWGSVNEGMADVIASLGTFTEKEEIDWYYKRSSVQDGPDLYDYAPTSVTSHDYGIPAYCPSEVNDAGCVHLNAVLLVRVAEQIDQTTNLSAREQRKLWTTILHFMTIESGYDSIEQYVILSARLHGWESQKEAIEQSFASVGITPGMDKKAYLTACDEGYGRVYMEVPELDQNDKEYVISLIKEDGSGSSAYVNEEGYISKQVLAGSYMVTLYSYDLWTSQIEVLKENIAIEVKNAETVTIPR